MSRCRQTTKRRAFLAAAGASMASLAGCLGDPQYRVTDASVESSPGPLSLSVAIRDPNAVVQGPARFAFTLKNPTANPIEVLNHGVWPFGLLGLSSSANDNSEETVHTFLYSPTYAKSSHVHVNSDRSGMNENMDDLIHALGGGEAKTVEYLLHGDDIPRKGTYYVVGGFNRPFLKYATKGNDWKTFTPKVPIAIRVKKRLPL